MCVCVCVLRDEKGVLYQVSFHFENVIHVIMVHKTKIRIIYFLGPPFWAVLTPCWFVCIFTSQSPVNIRTFDSSRQTGLGAFTFNRNDDLQFPVAITNKGTLVRFLYIWTKCKKHKLVDLSKWNIFKVLKMQSNFVRKKIPKKIIFMRISLVKHITINLNETCYRQKTMSIDG